MCRVVVGESIVELDADDAKDFVESKKSKLGSEKTKISAKIDENSDRLNKLKIILVAKFRDSINLEE